MDYFFRLVTKFDNFISYVSVWITFWISVFRLLFKLHCYLVIRHNVHFCVTFFIGFLIEVFIKPVSHCCLLSSPDSTKREKKKLDKHSIALFMIYFSVLGRRTLLLIPRWGNLHT